MNPHWIELAAVVLGLIKIIVQLGRMLEKFDLVLKTVKDHGRRLTILEQYVGIKTKPASFQS